MSAVSAASSGATGTDRYREFKMPDVGEGLTEAEILKWYVQPGEAVTDGQVVCEVETAKAAVELPIPFDGVVHELRFPEGTTVDVGQVIIAVDVAPGSGGAAEAAPPAEPDEAEDGDEPQGRQPVLVGYGVAQSSTKRRPRKSAEAAVPAPAEAPAPQAEPAPQVNGHGSVQGSPPAGSAAASAVRALAKPPVRKLAKDLGVDLATVVPTGDGGIVTRDDVRAAAAAATAPAAEPAAEPALAPAPGAQ
ncbi:2-oxo acid dehydrogenase subunit E2, partial [Streptomyces triticagri]